VGCVNQYSIVLIALVDGFVDPAQVAMVTKSETEERRPLFLHWREAMFNRKTILTAATLAAIAFAPASALAGGRKAPPPPPPPQPLFSVNAIAGGGAGGWGGGHAAAVMQLGG
jgi:hypothetical protein